MSKDNIKHSSPCDLEKLKLKVKVEQPFCRESNRVWRGAVVKGWGKRDIPEKTHRPKALSGTIPTCENPIELEVRTVVHKLRAMTALGAILPAAAGGPARVLQDERATSRGPSSALDDPANERASTRRRQREGKASEGIRVSMNLAREFQSIYALSTNETLLEPGDMYVNLQLQHIKLSAFEWITRMSALINFHALRRSDGCFNFPEPESYCLLFTLVKRIQAEPLAWAKCVSRMVEASARQIADRIPAHTSCPRLHHEGVPASGHETQGSGRQALRSSTSAPARQFWWNPRQGSASGDEVRMPVAQPISVLHRHVAFLPIPASKTTRVWSSAGIKGRGKREIPEKTRQTAASSGMIATCENPGVTQQANRSATAAPRRWESQCWGYYAVVRRQQSSQIGLVCTDLRPQPYRTSSGRIGSPGEGSSGAAKSIAQLMEWLQEEWRQIPVDILQTLVESMPDRVAAVIATRGGPTRF
ncbi:hypothetical protein PR048_024100 [Dryococelus australis]|uniref:Uncharacterized protein n=1 Tax=Dryococelus australis TaxID=614101 RepID=A0ABQ9GVY4_9NEOP|nr:hypothetical protein PR048_024100 [Dryococelus australis]